METFGTFNVLPVASGPTDCDPTKAPSRKEDFQCSGAEENKRNEREGSHCHKQVVAVGSFNNNFFRAFLDSSPGPFFLTYQFINFVITKIQPFQFGQLRKSFRQVADQILSQLQGRQVFKAGSEKENDEWRQRCNNCSVHQRKETVYESEKCQKRKPKMLRFLLGSKLLAKKPLTVRNLQVNL